MCKTMWIMNISTDFAVKMWITHVEKSDFKNPHKKRAEKGYELKNVDEDMSLSTSYAHFVDKLLHSGQVCFQFVDEKMATTSCIKNEILITICCISENNDFYA